jgi:lipopolysaccharide export system permease protein
VFLGILHRYVIDQVARSFMLALLTLTGVIVLFMVMAEATRQGLAPQAVIKLIPYIIPGTLPYTVPVALLFAVSVVYGRMAGDNEVIAVKAAGQSAWTILVPSFFLGAVLAGGLALMSSEVIPRSNHAFKLALFRDAEETFYMMLKREREFNNPRWPFFVGVKDVRDRLLVGATFKRRSKNTANPNSYDLIVQAEQAVIQFDDKSNQVTVRLKNAIMQGDGQFTSSPSLELKYALPAEGMMGPIDKRVQEMTSTELGRESARVRKLLRTERARQAIAAGLWMAAGKIERVDWPHIRDAYREDARWQRQSYALHTEQWVRNALAVSVLFFVVLGAPVGILFARRDFLSAFMTCFVPIIVLYYPLVLAGINMCKEGILPPMVVWSGNAVLALLAALFALPPVLRH